MSERNSRDICSSVSKRTRWGSFGNPVSSSMTETLTPLGVENE